MFLRSAGILFKIISFLLVSYSVYAQDFRKDVIRQSLAVASFSSDFELSPKWTLNLEVQERIYTDPVRQSQMFLKSQIGFEPFENFNFRNGIAYYLNSPSDPEFLSTLIVPEIRLNHDFAFGHKFRSIELIHRYRMEERFIHKKQDDSLIDGYRFVERISYMLALECKLINSKNHKHDIFLKLSDGIYVNTHNGILFNSFDQNRFYAGLNYQLVKNLTVELGYINLYQQRISGVEYLNRNIASLGINHSLKLYH
ncbi:MAG: hypothetical protein B7X86_03580 [Sphingobacteriales bacterium 17-39-43]|uniref:DUF2490 domain-containing protein n=1 Tax=Daejeonella sp. TaxID=2805397 RepID=UPI000BDB7967|nr:DUF2490 domain-containing protein [Daejeonella sp.]OYZ32423.1 MAG: hypothetical protein B7Y24_04405 [Sphingobacteriales bacterium 16-39-50]OYZ59811.1 MAG: hypothetical protein B7Y19_00675 [Sphingobacteriales bacterium 24-40-4]OZA25786.1 MAG: hypothetical protein B7X86_03580 [Sphingobacteriales bacterium 17-39-43]OZA62210.1 MAG: hypothetical protein B7X75_00385 [Sphingobacteriales bacterium 39-40-5]HQS04259.1 DUF2490 domain-containing protein [Daejeonella sp.]